MKNKIKKWLINIAKKNVFLRELMYSVRTKKQTNTYMKKYYKKYEVDDKLCVFESFNGRKYSDSPKAVYLRMLNDPEYKDYKFVWAFNNPENFEYLAENPRTKVVKYHSDEYKKTYASAKYWFTPSRLPDYIIPKEEQVYCQFWHGTPLKRLGFDIQMKGMNALHTVKDWQRMYQYDASRYTYMVSPSEFTSDKYRSAFNLKAVGKENCILETGYPRNDALFSFDDEYVKKLRKELGIPKGKKVILYAPTWRDNQHQAGVGYTYELGIDFDKFQKKFGKDYVILFTVHYLVASRMDLSKYEGFIINVSDYPDLNDLYIASDMIITDYSSVFFDYANLKRPMLFYMYDLDMYKGKMRDFYFDLSELPGPIVEKEEDLYKEIKNIDKYFKKYGEKYKKFNEKFNYLDDADSSKRVLDIIIKGDANKKMKKVITYGTYDLLTAGHVEHFRDAKAMGDYLIVGVSTDEFNAIKNKKSYLTYEERKFIVESIKYVDEVIPEEHWDQKPGDIEKYGIDIVAMGSDWEGDERFEKLRQYCDVQYTYRSGKYSSTDFRKHVDNYAKEKVEEKK